MSDAYDWSAFTVHFYYRATRDEVFRAWATAAGLSGFFIGSARHAAPGGGVRAQDEVVAAGDTYAWAFLHGLSLTGTFLACVPGERVAFTFGDAMQVDVTLRSVGDQVEVRLHQTGCGQDESARAWQHLNCRSCWVYFLTNLKSVLEHGVDLRDHDATDLNDAVSIGFAPAS
jgi:uncharacterized protein YndB with AHSA1/START domain